ncbi:hypothetical protein Alches_18460 [Alicyclobacillus hesperidum subsp. aegles]|nr:hypothetical protein Alches_18460 [Alicyclobacillus hesperidum subsp. aegles]
MLPDVLDYGAVPKVPSALRGSPLFMKICLNVALHVHKKNRPSGKM